MLEFNRGLWDNTELAHVIQSREPTLKTQVSPWTLALSQLRLQQKVGTSQATSYLASGMHGEARRGYFLFMLSTCRLQRRVSGDPSAREEGYKEPSPHPRN